MLENVNNYLLLQYAYPSHSGARKLQASRTQEAVKQSGAEAMRDDIKGLAKPLRCNLLEIPGVLTSGEYETIDFQPVIGYVSPPAQIGDVVDASSAVCGLATGKGRLRKPR